MDERQRAALMVISTFFAGIMVGVTRKAKSKIQVSSTINDALSLGVLDREIAVWVTKAVDDGMDRREIIARANEMIKYRNIVAGEISRNASALNRG